MKMVLCDSSLFSSTHIAEPAMLWLDTYFQWISPASNCCGIFPNNTICRPPGKDGCGVCLQNHTKDNRPYSEDFKKYLRPFLNANPDKDCPAAGQAAFGGGVRLSSDNTSVESKSSVKEIMSVHLLR